MQHRAIYTSEQGEFREAVRRFARKEIEPFEVEWRERGITPREIWLKAGALGILCPQVPEEYGGAGLTDYRYQAILSEEIHSSSLGFGLQTGVTVNYLLNFGTEQQKRRWLPRAVAGETIMAIAMTEPGTGSDLKSVRTTAVRQGDDYVVNGQKTFISSGQLADLVILVARTSPNAGAHGISLLLVEADRPGFRRGRKLRKLGRHGADTSELFFDDVRVPASNLLGAENRGFMHLMKELPAERLGIAISGIVDSQRGFDLTARYVKERRVFGKRVADFQHTRFELADIQTELQVTWAFIDQCIVEQARGELTPDKAAMAKLWTTELQFRILDRCLQLHGGYGYMEEYEIARLWADARAQRLYGGTSEIMRDIIGRAICADDDA
jgi:alkylation response protein AidB-like acyl-CoA dehydrogenase